MSGNIELVSDAAGQLDDDGGELKGFMKSKQLPDPVSPAFVKALQEVLSGLEKVALSGTGLKVALSEGGLPCTVDELHERFDRYLNNLKRGKDASKIRIIIE